MDISYSEAVFGPKRGRDGKWQHRPMPFGPGRRRVFAKVGRRWAYLYHWPTLSAARIDARSWREMVERAATPDPDVVLPSMTYRLARAGREPTRFERDILATLDRLRESIYCDPVPI